MEGKNVNLLDFEGNPNIGIYMFANDKVCFIGNRITENKKKNIEKALGVPVYNVQVLGTELAGIFIAGNNDFLIIPQVYEHEKEIFEQICTDHNMKLIEIADMHNTFGNNICVADKTILVNPNYSDVFNKELSKKTGYKIFKIKSTKYHCVGATCIHLNGKYFISQEYDEKEVASIINDVAGVGSVNKGSAYIASGIVGNSNGILIGSASSTIEIQNIIESLNYL